MRQSIGRALLGMAMTASAAAAAAMSAGNQTDVLVIGSGGAGLAAAIAAREADADVVVLEKLGFVGGTTLLASTAFNAGGSELQLSQKTPYTANDYFEQLKKGAGGKELENLRQLADLSGPAVDWLVSMGADLGRVINGSQHTPKSGGALGASLVPVMKKRADALGVEFRLNSQAESLLTDSQGRVIGAKVKTPSGDYTLTAKTVVLATGGFASNPDMVKTYTPDWAGYPSTASPGATGDGIRMAQALGAAVTQMNLAGPQVVAYDTGHGAVSLTNVRYNGAILVNREGRRFANELGLTAELGKAIKAQTGGAAYLIFDQACIDRAELMQTYEARGYFVKAGTLDELAQKLGIDAKTLSETVKDWSTVFDAKTDKAFGRKDSIFSRLDKAPFYGQRISPANQTTYGGVKRDLKGRALRSDGTAIPGLFAAGETASQYGQGVSIAVVLGRLAGTNAAKEAKTLK